MVEVDALANELNDGVGTEYVDPNFLAYMQVRVAIANAEQLQRIADILESVIGRPGAGSKMVVNGWDNRPL